MVRSKTGALVNILNTKILLSDILYQTNAKNELELSCSRTCFYCFLLGYGSWLLCKELKT